MRGLQLIAAASACAPSFPIRATSHLLSVLSSAGVSPACPAAAAHAALIRSFTQASTHLPSAPSSAGASSACPAAAAHAAQAAVFLETAPATGEETPSAALARAPSHPPGTASTRMYKRMLREGDCCKGCTGR
eukprot:1157388-Pelagomonas_calceolata.AAC.18